MDYPNTDELENTYSVYLKTILSHTNYGKGEMSKSSKKVARFMVETYDSIKQKFSVDEYRHYLITPRELTTWAFNLMRYEAPTAE